MPFKPLQARASYRNFAQTQLRELKQVCVMNRKIAALFFLRLRGVIAYELELESEAMIGGEIEVEEGYLGGRRKGRRGRGAARKVPVFGQLNRGGKIYAKTTPQCIQPHADPYYQAQGGP